MFLAIDLIGCILLVLENSARALGRLLDLWYANVSSK